MECRLILFLVGILVILFGIWLQHTFDIQWSNLSTKPEVDLAVCILSARNHFDLRDAIRNTWLKDFNTPETLGTMSTIASFIVGSDSCSIHPDYRIDPYSCKEWMPSISALSEEYLISFTLPKVKQIDNECLITSASYLVMQDILLKRVGIAELFPFHGGEDVQVVLYDTVTMSEISRTRFSNLLQGVSIQGYKYRPLDMLLLPKGYQLTLTLESVWVDQQPQVEEIVRDTSLIEGLHQSHGGLLHLQSFRYLLPLGSGYSNNCTRYPLMSALFHVKNKSTLESLVRKKQSKMEEWSKTLRHVTALLSQEMSDHNDIVMVDMLDVYRELPRKLLLCHQWLSENVNARFVLKTDDDVYLNKSRVLSGLFDLDSDTPLWWGNFRTGWAVERHGKWQEDSYAPYVYPDFSCGSGNVVSRPVHLLLVSHQHSLAIFQGEDVSMGIWLSVFNINYISDPRWRCDNDCVPNFLSLPELNVSSLHWYCNSSMVCHNPCHSC